jgi:hypothetical protein
MGQQCLLKVYLVRGCFDEGSSYSKNLQKEENVG